MVKGVKRDRDEESVGMDCDSSEITPQEQPLIAQKHHRSAASASAPLQDSPPMESHANSKEFVGACMVYVSLCGPLTL